MPNRAPKFECSPLMGVYRFRHKIGGRTAWYSINAAGDYVDFRVMCDGDDQAVVVMELAKGIGLAPGRLTLVGDLSSPSARAPRSLLTRVAPALPSGPPALTVHR